MDSGAFNHLSETAAFVWVFAMGICVGAGFVMIAMLLR